MADPTAPTFSMTITGSDPDETTTAQALEASVQGVVDQVYDDYTGAKIKLRYEEQSNTNALTDDRAAKLDALDAQATTDAALVLKAPLASPALTGTPAAPTALEGDDSTQIATTAFVQGELGGKLSTTNNLSDLDDASAARDNLGVTSALASKAPLASPALTGTPTAPTALEGANTTQIATAAFVQGELAGKLDVVDNLADIDDASAARDNLGVTDALAAKAPLASPTFTGTVSGVTKAHVGLGSVDNTADIDKPVSTAAQAALDFKSSLADMQRAKTVAIWSNILPSHITVDRLGKQTDINQPQSIFSTLYSGQKLTVNAAGRLPVPQYPSYLFNEGANYTTDPSLAMPSSGELHHVHGVGQSYTQGTVDTIYSTSALHAGVALMLSGGVMPLGAPSGGFSDLIATDTYEPPVLTAVNDMVATLEDKLGESVPMVASVSAFGGKPYYALMRGSSRWQETRRIFDEVRYNSAAMGKTPILTTLAIHEGEADATLNASVEMAVGQIMRWRLDHQELAEEVYGQKRQCVAVLYSTNRSHYAGDIRMTPWQAACREVVKRAPHLFALCGPAYAVEHNAMDSDNENHPTVTGYRRLGGMIGRAALGAVYGTFTQSCDIVSVEWITTTEIKLTCHVPYGGNLAIDTSGDIVGDVATTCGFNVETDGGSITVNSVSVSGKEITITLNSAGTVGGTRLGYAMRGTSGIYGGDNTDMARGTIRGSVAHSLAGSAVDSYDFLNPFAITI